MAATRVLPGGYILVETLDLSMGARWQVALNGLGVVLLGVAALFFVWATAMLRPAVLGEAWAFLLEHRVGTIVAVFPLTALMVVVHELVHGLFFWLFTQEKPLFGLRGVYAYAAAPDWYLTRNQHLIIALAPLVLISVVGVGLVPVVAPPVVAALLLILIMNAGGAVGDVVTGGWLLTKSGAVLVRDVGDKVLLYAPRVVEGRAG